MAKKATLKGAVAISQNPAVKGKIGKFVTTGQTDNANIAVQNTAQNAAQNTAQNNLAAQANASTSDTAQTIAEEFANAQNQGNVDPTSQAQATTKEEVDAQDARTRLWQSLSDSYKTQIEKSEKDYERAKVSTEAQMLNRGLGRSSYALALQAQLEDKKANATRDILSSQIADYQNRLSDLEYKEQQQANWQAEFDAGRADAAWSQQFQQQQFDYQQKTDDQKVAYDSVLRMLETNDNPSDELLKRAGLTRHDYNQLKAAKKKSKKSGGSKGPGYTPPGDTDTQEWKQRGFKSAAEYAAWLRANSKDKSVRDATTIKKEQLDLRKKRGY